MPLEWCLLSYTSIYLFYNHQTSSGISGRKDSNLYPCWDHSLIFITHTSNSSIHYKAKTETVKWWLLFSYFLFFRWSLQRIRDKTRPCSHTIITESPHTTGVTWTLHRGLLSFTKFTVTSSRLFIILLRHTTGQYWKIRARMLGNNFAENITVLFYSVNAS